MRGSEAAPSFQTGARVANEGLSRDPSRTRRVSLVEGAAATEVATRMVIKTTLHQENIMQKNLSCRGGAQGNTKFLILGGLYTTVNHAMTPCMPFCVTRGISFVALGSR
jgi:hypothetical protein